MYPFSLSNLIHFATGIKTKHRWVQVRILHETDKAILVYIATKIWIPKFRIHGIRLKNNVFEVYVEACVVG